jgi:hypothetical protein
MVPEEPYSGGQINTTIRLAKVEVEMLRELQKKYKRHKGGLEREVLTDLHQDFSAK